MRTRVEWVERHYFMLSDTRDLITGDASRKGLVEVGTSDTQQRERVLASERLRTEAVKRASTETQVPRPLSLLPLTDSLSTRIIALVHKLYLFENGKAISELSSISPFACQKEERRNSGSAHGCIYRGSAHGLGCIYQPGHSRGCYLTHSSSVFHVSD
jgi:hypothetical protein